MKPSRWFGRACLAALGVIIACGKETPTQAKGWEFAPGSAKSVLDSSKIMDTTKAYFSAAGCSPSTGPGVGRVALIQVPLHGFNRFSCQGMSHDSVTKITLTYHRWIEDLIAGGMHTTSQEFYWDYQEVDVPIDVYCNAQAVLVPANAQYRVIDPNGNVTSEGRQGPAATGIYVPCDPYHPLHSQLQIAIAMASGWPMPGAPPFDFVHPGDSPGADGETPDPITYPIIAKVTIDGGGTLVKVGEQTPQFTASVVDADGSPIGDYTLSWSPGGAKASLGDAGRYIGVDSGFEFISVTASGVEGSSVGSATATMKIHVFRDATDTVCKASTDSTTPKSPGVSNSFFGSPENGPLASKAMQDSAATLHNRGNTKEPGGRMDFSMSNHEWVFHRVENALNSSCSYLPVGGYPEGTRIVINGDSFWMGAFIHGHPDEGDSLSLCDRQVPPGGLFSQLGISDSDRYAGDSLSYKTNTNFVVQKDQFGMLNIFSFGSLRDPVTGDITRDADHLFWKAGSSCASKIN